MRCGALFPGAGVECVSGSVSGCTKAALVSIVLADCKCIVVEVKR